MSRNVKYTKIELQPVNEPNNSDSSEPSSSSGVHDFPTLHSDPESANTNVAVNPSSSSTAAAAADASNVQASSNDGVFSNVEAKPEFDDYLDLFEKTPDEPLPTYLDIYGPTSTSAPSYFEPAIVSIDGGDELLVDGLPVGSLFVFLCNFMISYAFQAVGFMMTFLLHTSHAAKNGSIAGFGATLINIGFYLQTSIDESQPGRNPDGSINIPPPNNNNGQDIDFSTPGNNVYIAFLFIIIGWCLILKSGANYFHAKRMEQIITSNPSVV
ncbi:Metal homeostatis protein BSD2 [Smittium mucronatum]|uniref:Metal homeostatis protein BSD2 n=1 Tax=Smittium mucronatum TaxID=133383 RepID=A0A1R0H3P6_9FUNG|nr:Metal homeostatis protein BSD2 [Smittium mucronatum]